MISKKFTVLLHTLSAYNSLLVRCKVYSSDPKECLCTSWTYAGAYENFSIEPAPCRKNPITKIKLSYKLSAVTTRRKLHWDKSVTAKVCLVGSPLLGKLKLKRKRDSQSFLRKLSQASFETEHLSQPFDIKSWY